MSNLRKLDALVAIEIMGSLIKPDWSPSSDTIDAFEVARLAKLTLTPGDPGSEPLGICLRALKARGIDVSEWEK